jgi:hypothetical protein
MFCDLYTWASYGKRVDALIEVENLWIYFYLLYRVYFVIRIFGIKTDNNNEKLL